MWSPLGFEKEFGAKVCKLKKALYGLKQSPTTWFERFTQFVKDQGYYQAQLGHTMFMRFAIFGEINILIVYVANVVLIGYDLEEMARLM